VDHHGGPAQGVLDEAPRRKGPARGLDQGDGGGALREAHTGEEQAPVGGLRERQVIFDIGGNKYRLIVRFRYARPSAKPPLNGIALVKFIGTHQEYDAIDVEKL
jgi:hypothetical protein